MIAIHWSWMVAGIAMGSLISGIVGGFIERLAKRLWNRWRKK